MAGEYPEPVIAKCGILETILHIALAGSGGTHISLTR